MFEQLVSVIITTKNSAKTLDKLLKSIKDQSYSNVEIIVVDNASSDNTKEIAWKYTKQVYDKGPERSSQRNFGVTKAKGKYLLILDSDMELTTNVIRSCLKTIGMTKAKALVIPEKTAGQGFLVKVRQFEREMYMGDLSIEVARFFEKRVFEEFGGYDLELTGPEDYDLPYRIGKKYKIGRANQYILHHEEGISLKNLLQKKYYYASRGAVYANKHPELVLNQGNLLFRKAYFRNWKKFLKNPLIGTSFVFVRSLETAWAVAGYVSAVGFNEFVKTAFRAFK